MMSSPFPGLNWTVSTGQTGLDRSAETALREKAAPPTSSATAAALLDATMPFMSFSLKECFIGRTTGCALASPGEREKSCERANRCYAAPRREQGEMDRYRANWNRGRSIARGGPGVS